jgi:hypothetical protein
MSLRHGRLHITATSGSRILCLLLGSVSYARSRILLPPSDRPEVVPISDFCKDESSDLPSHHVIAGKIQPYFDRATRMFVSPRHTIGGSLQVRRLLHSLAYAIGSPD